MLDVATVRCAPAGKPDVSLVGVTHIGSRLYSRLERLLDAHSLVLYESVMPPESTGRTTPRRRSGSRRRPGRCRSSPRCSSGCGSGAGPSRIARQAARLAAAARQPRGALLPAATRDAWATKLAYERRLRRGGRARWTSC
ncbi:MAG: hypothetical protein U0575_04420 [Phycisphaerales bacterium]